jgi:hypothetical protein
MTSRQKKIRKVMSEFEAGTLKSSSGEPVKDPRQAMAIALSQAGVSKKGKSDDYVAGYIDEMMGSGEARCRGYLRELRKRKAKKS